MFDLFILLGTLFASLGVGVVSSPVHSVLFLVLTFRFAALALLSVGMEFFALLFLVIYMGAIAILFLFVVMMLDLKEPGVNDATTGSFSSLFLFIFPSVWFGLQVMSSSSYGLRSSYVGSFHEVNSIQSLGLILYTDYFPFFRVAGFILLVALMGAVILAVPRPYHLVTQKEDLPSQLSRDPSSALFHVVSK